MSVTLFIVLGAAAILGAAGYFFLRSARSTEQVPMHYFRCPECGQKMRYAATRGGRNVNCPRCRKVWTLPTTPQPLTKAGALAVGSVRGRNLASRRSVEA